MKEKEKFMKKVVILLSMLVILLFISSYNDNKTKKISGNDIIDEDFFKNELNNSILEFTNDLGLSEDSVYLID